MSPPTKDVVLVSRGRLAGSIDPDQPALLGVAPGFDGIIGANDSCNAADAVVASGVRVERASALPWLEARLKERVLGSATVLFHSVMWLYLDREERRGIKVLMDHIGESSDSNCPLAWLRMDARDFDTCELRLRLWPTGDDRVLGTCGFHGQKVEWFG